MTVNTLKVLRTLPHAPHSVLNWGAGGGSWETLGQQDKPLNPKGDQSWIFIGRTVDKAEALILWPPDVKSWLMGKTLILGKIKGRRRRGQQRTGWFDGIIESMDMSGASSGKWWRTGKPDVLQSMGLQRVRYDLVTEQHTVIHPKLRCWNLIPRGLGGGALFKSWG